MLVVAAEMVEAVWEAAGGRSSCWLQLALPAAGAVECGGCNADVLMACAHVPEYNLTVWRECLTLLLRS
jgi:hypothetical protein